MLRYLQFSTLLLLVMLLSESAVAQPDYSYTPSGPVTFRTKFGGVKTQVVSITNETSSPTFLKIRFFGDTSFRFNSQSEYLNIGADSTANFTVTYLASWRDTSVGYLRLYDSVHTADTIKFIGMDTIYVEPPPQIDWKIDSTSQLFAGSYYGLPDTAIIRVRNISDHEISVTSAAVAGYGFVLEGSYEHTISAGSTTDFKYAYWSQYDSAWTTVRIAGRGIVDSARIEGRNLLPPPLGDSLTWGGLYFGSLLPGDTICKQITIYNRYDKSAQITAMNMVQDSNYFVLDQPSLPLTVFGHDSVTLTFCFNSPHLPAQQIRGSLEITYNFPDTASRMRQIYLLGHTHKCLISNSGGFINFGRVARYSKRSGSYHLVNYRSTTVLVDSVRLTSNSAPGFAIEGNYTNFSLGHNDSVQIVVSYEGNGDTTTQAGFVKVYTRDVCDSVAYFVLTARSYDSSGYHVFNLYGDSTETLVFTDDSSASTQSFTFINDLPDSIRVLSIGLKDGTHFGVYSVAPHAPELDLGPNDLMEVTLQVIGNPGTYEDTLLIVTETGIIALYFPIVAHLKYASGVENSASSDPILTISPNPSSGPLQITLDHARNARIEILDVMGKVIARVGIGTWDPSMVARGVYFIRASGIGEDGKPFITTSRLVVR